jgi:hypothetical protein
MLQIGTIQYRKLDFEEFCAAAISVHQLEGTESWEQHARLAYELFEKDGNRPIMIEELASVLSLSLMYFASRDAMNFIFYTLKGLLPKVAVVMSVFLYNTFLISFAYSLSTTAMFGSKH